MSKKGKIQVNVNDVIGKRLGKLQVVSYAGCRYDDTKAGKRLRHFYIVHCDCGVTKVIHRNQITSDLTHSCGCSKSRKHYGD